MCLDLSIENNASLKVTVDLTVNGSLDIFGSLVTEGFIFIRIYGNVSWQANSFSALSDQTYIEAYGDWYNLPGSNNSMNQGYVNFKGNNDSYIYSDESSSTFHNLTNNKVPPASLNIHANSAEDLIIEGYLLNQAGAILNIFSSHFLIMNGIINSDSGLLHCFDGVVLLRDPSENFIPAQGSFFNNLIVEFGAGTWNIWDYFCDTLFINGSLSITSGQINLNYLDITVGLNLFDTHHGLVTVNGDIIFNGDYPEQMVKGIQVQKIVVDKPGNGLVIFADDTSQVGIYDWISGGIAVQNAVLEIDQLDDDGLAGIYHLSGGQLTVHNTPSVDLGELKISSGKMQLHSGMIQRIGRQRTIASLKCSTAN